MESQETLVSIVMPVYNSEAYMDEAVLSIIHQTYQNWELLVVNEFGSSEEGTRIIKRYEALDKRIRLIQNTQRLGIAESLNEGLRQAKGKYIARMDADDISLPRRLEKQVLFLEENPDILLCGLQVEVFGSSRWDWTLETDPGQIRQDILFYTPCVHPTIMFRREVVDQYGVFYNPEYRASEDYDFFTRIIQHGEIANLKEVLFRYRLYGTNATYLNNDIGFKIYSNVMGEQFRLLEMDFTKDEVDLLSVHYSLKGMEGKAVLEGLARLDVLLKDILYTRYKKGIDRKELGYLFKTLHRRFKEAHDSLSWNCKNYDQQKAEAIYKNALFYREKFYLQTRFSSTAPEITVLLPLYNGDKYIAETIWSVLDQSFADFELLIVNEFGSSQRALDMIGMFVDNRIRIICNKKRLGLAESLNEGIRQARGRYIARIDGDDLAQKDRFKKQYNFLDKHKEYGLCGSYQHHFGIDTDFMHCVPQSHDEIKARLIYDCEICHSTIMIRRDYFMQNNLYYDPKKQAEDYELWTRAIRKFKFYNIPEALGEYRIGSDNITLKKKMALSKESGELAYKNITETLKVEIPKEHIPFLSGWVNEFQNQDKEHYQSAIRLEREILQKMWDNNLELKEYKKESLLRVINKRWRWATATWSYGSELGEILPVEQLFKQYNPFSDMGIKNDEGGGEQREKEHLGFKERIKKILKFFYKPFTYGIQYRIRRQLWDLDGHLTESVYDIKNNLWDAEGRIKNSLWSAEGHIKDLIAANSTLDPLHQLQDHVKELHGKLEYMESKMDNLMGYLELRLNAQDTLAVNQSDQMMQQVDTRVWKSEEKSSQQFAELAQQLDTRVWKSEEKSSQQFAELAQQLDTRVWKAEEKLGEQLDARVWTSEEKSSQQFTELAQQLDTRVWKSEEKSSQQFAELTQQLDARIWKAEELLGEKLDGRIWQSELYLKKAILSRIWTLNAMLAKLQEKKGGEQGVTSIYGKNFYEENQYGSFTSAVEVWQYLLPIYTPKSMVDFGCGTGTWLAAAKQVNRDIEVLGVDGDYVDRDLLMIAQNQFVPEDLSQPLDLHRKFDMAVSLEVAEHIEETCADTFVDSLCRHSDTILFSAAHVGQGGDGHVNEQPLEYWVEKFKKRGYQWLDIRKNFEKNYDVEEWYRDNMALFIKE